MPDLTEKYGHFLGDEEQKHYASARHKSGLSPLNLGPFEARANVEDMHRWEAYQKKRFEGFTTHELAALETLAPLFAGGSNPGLDDVPIHPLYARENWNPHLGNHEALYPLRREREGFWHASNDTVWEAIVPALKLVSKFLMNGNAWLDALISGHHLLTQQNISEFFRRFNCRDPWVAQQEGQRAKVQDKLRSIASKVDLGFVSGHNQPHSGFLSSSVFSSKMIPLIEQDREVRIIIALEIVEPLLRTDLTPAERAIETFRLASILAYQTVLFGGVPAEFIPMDKSIPDFRYPAGGMWKSDWDKIIHSTHSDYIRYNLLKVDRKFHTRERWAIPMGFFLDLCQQLFWETHVRRFGPGSIRMGPLILGSQSTFLPYSEDRKLMYHRSYEPAPVRVGYELSDQDKKSLDFENERRSRAIRIRKQLSVYATKYQTSQDKQLEIQVRGPSSQQPPPRFPGRARSARYDEIRWYLSNNMYELAFDTLNFAMPEHVMYAHIIRRGGIQLSADEWRSFLEECHWKALLFSHNKTGTCILWIQQNHIGWPPVSPVSRAEWPKPHRDVRRNFIRVSRDVIRLYPHVFSKGYLDHDKDDFRKLCGVFEPDVFEALLYWCDKEKRMFTYGPEGIIRLLRDDKTKQKGKCRQM